MRVIELNELTQSDVGVFSIMAMRQYWKNHSRYSFTKDAPRIQNGFTLILCREAIYTLGSGGSFRAPRNSLVCLPAGSVYSVEFLTDGANEGVSSMVVNFTLRDEDGELLSLTPEPCVVLSDDDAQVYSRLLPLIEDLRVRNALALKRHFFSFLSLVSPSVSEKRYADGRMGELLEYIEQNIADDVSLPTLGAHFGMSASTLRRRFERELGMAPVEYINRLRVERAKELICTDEITNEMICEQVGFYDPSHFYKVFKRYAEMTPNEWRCQNLKLPKND